MQIFRLVVGLFLSQVVFVASSSANDFDWMDSLNVMAKADSSGFQIRLATRFHVGDTQIKAVIGNVDSAADAYMILRLGELTHRPIKDVVSVYHAHRNKGWGVVAKELGIKPGSREFHALKGGHDMQDGHGNDHNKPSMTNGGKGHGNGMGNGKG